MYHEQDCGCGRHAGHHGEPGTQGNPEGCGHHFSGRHGMGPGGPPHPGCTCPHHRQLGQGSFRRHFVSRQEVAHNLEDYLKQLQAEAKGVEERIAELKKGGESQQTQ